MGSTYSLRTLDLNYRKAVFFLNSRVLLFAGDKLIHVLNMLYTQVISGNTGNSPQLLYAHSL